MEAQNKVISVELSDGTNVRVEATLIGERKLSTPTRPFREVTVAIESLTKEIAEAIQKVKPDRASVKFGVEIALESGKLTPVLVKGTSTANLEITLEWGQHSTGEFKIQAGSAINKYSP
ncbi:MULTISPECIES: CU044_2847 family protein [Calothrix]|uniref:Trypsin-co-occurring domain-containing protein n=2 Tax=Calothrix TaxID=1186 RepID=A0ABR8A5C4_9CYAN|nr:MULTISPECIES: CU044_2847 family protein [Calothrix]BAY62558.1 hypothetical protein NIES22_26320 [Calothrix brevissima NIES-22]MBD2195167.1 hypothetical protein [Calothrix parietina FACHB-288]MBD2203594.1 hypothetical protein [Calothrix sp. FACHB-168]MBD2219900.1 hypothetical protein [Calothrix sp. FACHB-1219]MBD2223862.1 hypothetical protein [Calothrix anomala FACHB-343]